MYEDAHVIPDIQLICLHRNGWFSASLIGLGSTESSHGNMKIDRKSAIDRTLRQVLIFADWRARFYAADNVYLKYNECQ